MDLGSLPITDSRKICVAYTSTELEFAVFGDELAEVDFPSQREAIKALIERLEPTEWQIFIRRHPYKKKVRKDPEANNWAFLREYPHVTIIQPDSKIDSYAIGQISNLIAHYDSSIGPELIATERVPVISIGPAFWESKESGYLVNSIQRMKALDLSNIRVRSIHEIFPWALYMATFGSEFSYSEWRDTKSYISGQRIVEKRISEWII
jgi:hypothetical protein